MTVTRVLQGGPQSVGGLQTHNVCDITIGTYATGGVAVDPVMFGMKSVLGIIFAGSTLGDAGKYNFAYDTVTKKIKVYWTGAGTAAVFAEITDSSNLTGVTFRAYVVGY